MTENKETDHCAERENTSVAEEIKDIVLEDKNFVKKMTYIAFWAVIGFVAYLCLLLLVPSFQEFVIQAINSAGDLIKKIKG